MFRGRPSRARSQFEAPYGNSLVGSYALVARRHMHEFGTTSEQLAQIAVGVREYAGLNSARAVPRSDHRSTTCSRRAWSPTRCTSSTAA
jgi:acetyl-CoA acetyltransferase